MNAMQKTILSIVTIACVLLPSCASSERPVATDGSAALDSGPKSSGRSGKTDVQTVTALEESEATSNVGKFERQSTPTATFKQTALEAATNLQPLRKAAQDAIANDPLILAQIARHKKLVEEGADPAVIDELEKRIAASKAEIQSSFAAEPASVAAPQKVISMNVAFGTGNAGANDPQISADQAEAAAKLADAFFTATNEEAKSKDE